MSEKGKVVTPAPPGLINKEDIPQVLPILPLRNSVFFPGGVLPLAVGRQKTIALIKDAVRRGFDQPLEQALKIEAENFARAALSTDAAIGIMSFLSKQEPEFTGS